MRNRMTLALVTALLAAPCAAQPQEIRDCATCPVLVVVPKGEFVMGSPADKPGRNPNEPQRQATIGRPFAMGRYEVTVAQFAEFVKETAYVTEANCATGVFNQRPVFGRLNSWRDPGFVQQPTEPVVCVSWRNAQAYVEWLSAKTGKHYRLPTETEWEYAERGGSSTSYPWGSDPAGACMFANIADLDFFAHYTDNKPENIHQCHDGFVGLAPVGSLAPNAFGVYDMVGNASEWTASCDNEPCAEDAQRLTRGGDTGSGPRGDRAPFRLAEPPNARAFFLGFRVARDF